MPTQTTPKGYWTEGKIDPVTNTNIGGGVFVSESPTVLTSDKNEAIGKLNARANDISGVNQVGTGQETKPTVSSETQLWTDALKAVSEMPQMRQDPDRQKLYDLMSQNIDAQTQASLNQLQQAMAAKEATLVESQKASTKGLENTLLLGGSARYAPLSAQGLLSAKERYDLQTLQELHAKEESLKADVLQSQRQGKFQLMEKQLADYDKLRAEKLNMAKNISDSIIASNKEIRERKLKEQDEINKIVTEAGKNGAPQEVIDTISSSGTLGEAVKSAGSYLGTVGTGIVGEYNFYKKDAQARGLVPLSFDEYQTRDANRKVSIAKASVNAGGFTPQENSTFLTITNKYQADAVINSAIKADQINALANQIIKDPNKATNQLASLYIFVKNLDPESAVREGELGLANSTQSYLSKFGNTLARLAEGRVVSPDAASELAKATKALVKTWEQTAEKKTKLYRSQAYGSSPNVGTSFDQYIKNSEVFPTTNEQIAQEQEEKETSLKEKLNSIKSTNPNLFQMASSLFTSINEETGQPYTADEILQAFPELNQ